MAIKSRHLEFTGASRSYHVGFESSNKEAGDAALIPVTKSNKNILRATKIIGVRYEGL